MRRFAAVPFATLLLSTLAFAQAPQLLVKDPDAPAAKPHPIALAKADVQLLIAGQLCQTTMTLTFANDASRVLEGELVFPLPENAAVSAYALDVNDELVDAVTIEKEKARVVFETEVRKGIDPGLIEQVQGNNFRTRIYPIPAKGTRTIRVQYVAPAGATKDGRVTYPLPVQWPGATPQLSLRVESISAEPPTVANVPGLKFTSTAGRHVAEMKVDKAEFAGDVAASLPIAALPASVVEKRTRQTVSVENLDPKTAAQFEKVDHYFVLNDVPPVERTTVTRAPAKPGRIAIAWDASLSRGGVDHAKELELLERHLTAVGVDFDLIVLRNVAEPPVTLNIGLQGVAKAIAHLKALPYDGGTALSALRVARNYGDLLPNDGTKLNRPQDYGYYLLFTDGLTNLGPDLPAQVEVPVFAVSNDPRSNHALLRRLASQSGGQYLNLQTITPADALAAISERPFSLISIDADANEVADVYPRLPQPVQGRVTVAGRLLAKSAKVTLNYGRGGQVTHRVPMTITQDGATAEANLVSRFWAQLRLADLSITPDANERDITALGKQFNLVTPYTSMIVLETVEQYVLHKIVPPKTRAGVYAEFMKRIEQQQSVAQTEEKAKIDRVVAMWNARLAWWNQDFKYAADFKYVEPKEPKPVAAATDGVLLGGHESGVTRSFGRGSSGSGGGGGGGGGGSGGRPTDAPRGDSRAGNADQSPAVPSPGPAVVGDPAPNAQGQPSARGRDVRDLAVDGVPDFSNAPDFSLQQAGGRNRELRPEELARLRRAGIEAGGVEQRVSSGYFAERQKDGKDDATTGKSNELAIVLKPWSPDSPYMKALQAVGPNEAYAVYLDQRKAYESSPAFYLDCADFFAKSNSELALRILSNIPELALDDGRLLRIAAHRMQQIGQLDTAINLFERVAKLRPEEPQSFRDLALALADRADGFAANNGIDRARSDYERSLQLLHKVVMNPWQRFEEIEVIALTEANRILAAIANRKLQIANPFDPRLVKLLDPDLRIVMTWDTDNTDIDLHVTEPTGETCVYNHNRTTIGGALSKDFTQGYGPEEYLLKRLMPGQYKIQAHFYGNGDQRLVGPTTVQATVITNYGRPDEKRQALTLRLKDQKEMVDVGTVTLGR